jgi:hypothetical protein
MKFNRLAPNANFIKVECAIAGELFATDGNMNEVYIAVSNSNPVIHDKGFLGVVGVGLTYGDLRVFALETKVVRVLCTSLPSFTVEDC